jgi:hypothetical protein
MEAGHDARRFARLKSLALIDSNLLLPFTLVSEGAPRIHTTRERSVHKFIVHLLPVSLPRYSLSREHPAPIYRRYLQRNFRQALETKRAKRILFVRFRDDVCGRFGVKFWEHGPTVSVNLSVRHL